MVTLENEQLKVDIALLGAELTSVFNKSAQLEYLWQADPTYWKRHAPILFPIVGRLKEDRYTLAGKNYPMSQHGFARDSLFTVVAQSKTAVTLRLESSQESLAVYPFAFILELTYTLTKNAVEVAYKVVNPSAETLIFGIGGHPAFNVPLAPELSFEDYYLSTMPRKSRTQIPLNGAYLDLSKRTLFPTNSDLDLHHDIFEHDAIVLTTPGANAFTIATDLNAHKVTLSYEEGFPYTGIWSPYPKDAPFVCIEPWCGLADTVEATGELSDKFAMNHLAPGATFEQAYVITVD